MPSFSTTSLKQLATCDARLQDVLQAAILRVDFVILEGHRNEVDQNAAFAAGKSQKKWPEGNHNAYPSRAVDIAPYLPEVKIDWNDLVAFGRLMGYIQCLADQRNIKLRFGLDWDGDWRTAGKNDPNEHFLDAPHIELVG
jgi:hypothetical protein